MTVQHIAMVYEAGGMEANEKHLLGAYCNHTDGHGYCWPGIDRLADETGMSVRTVKRVNAALKAKNLIRSVRRVNPKTGEPITNLTRVNLRLLASMKRPEKRYEDDLINEITFDDEEQETPADLLMCQSDTHPGSDWHVGRGQIDTWVGVNLAPKTSIETSVELPSSSLLHDAAAQQSHEHRNEEGEGAILSRDNHERGVSETPGGCAAAWVLDLPWKRQPGTGQRERLAVLVDRAWASGWTPEALRRELTAELDGARSLYAVWLSRLEQLPATPAERPAPAHRDPAKPSGPLVLLDCTACGNEFKAPASETVHRCEDCREAA
ncbi:helix-turn-helix domain-containing protein (plasmid) [Microtetraspora malaysiensis]|uniref:helix-turn-helix domain-containing protein n=1 Tax=Microtetraspora malaysiensis TaxID=161358 RepID=UPI003D907ABB